MNLGERHCLGGIGRCGGKRGDERGHKWPGDCRTDKSGNFVGPTKSAHTQNGHGLGGASSFHLPSPTSPRKIPSQAALASRHLRFPIYAPDCRFCAGSFPEERSLSGNARLQLLRARALVAAPTAVRTWLILHQPLLPVIDARWLEAISWNSRAEGRASSKPLLGCKMITTPELSPTICRTCCCY